MDGRWGAGVFYIAFFSRLRHFFCFARAMASKPTRLFYLRYCGVAYCYLYFFCAIFFLIFSCLGWICSFGFGVVLFIWLSSVGTIWSWEDGLDGRLLTEDFFAWAGGLLFFPLSCIDVHGGVGLRG